MNVLGFSRESPDKMSGTACYRCFLPLREVNRADNGIEAIVMGPEELRGVIDQATGIDVYHWPRMSHGDCEEFVAEVHKRGAKFVIDSDDDLTEDYRLVSGYGEAFKKVLGHADYMTCATPALAEHLGLYTQRPPVVLRNHIDADWFAKTASKAKRVVSGLTIGFSGSPTHWGDWYMPAVPFQRIVRDFDVIPVVHGEAPRYMKFVSAETLELGGVPYPHYPILLAQFDIVLCAVDVGDEFSSGKSAIKAIECMAAGAVPICSRFGPYIDLAEAGAPIVLVEENTRDAWYEAMANLIQDSLLRKRLGTAGPDWVRENRDMARTGHKLWSDFYRSIVNDHIS